MKRITLLFALIILFLVNIPSHAQVDRTQPINVPADEYNIGLGLRLGGFTSGFSVKGFVSPRGALEGIVGFGRRSAVLTGLYEYHFPITGAKGLNLYAGGGGHVGFFGHRSTYLIYKYRNEKIYAIEDGHTAVIPGVDGIFGIEYKFQGAPFTVGADIKPFVDFYDGASHYFDGAINLRVVF